MLYVEDCTDGCTDIYMINFRYNKMRVSSKYLVYNPHDIFTICRECSFIPSHVLFVFCFFSAHLSQRLKVSY